MSETAKYCIDTNPLIDMWRRTYPRDVFGKLWNSFEGLIEEGVVISTREVLKELEKVDDDLSKKWAKNFKAMFIDPGVSELEKVKEIERRFLNFIDNSKTTPEADPFVIAVAISKGLTVRSC